MSSLIQIQSYQSYLDTKKCNNIAHGTKTTDGGFVDGEEKTQNYIRGLMDRSINMRTSHEKVI